MGDAIDVELNELLNDLATIEERQDSNDNIDDTYPSDEETPRTPRITSDAELTADDHILVDDVNENEDTKDDDALLSVNLAPSKIATATPTTPNESVIETTLTPSIPRLRTKKYQTFLRQMPTFPRLRASQ